MEFETLRLHNGLRVVIQQVDSPISHACVLIDAGSRDEEAHSFGVAHFVEHLLFKRTERRNTYQILNRLESVGADLNAYTTKEYTCIHASFLAPYLERTLDLFEDLLFHSVFPDEEIEKERGVILDEIASYQDSPEDAILDDFEDILFNRHPLGHNILGTEEAVKRITKDDILGFMRKYYRPENMVIGISGNYRPAQLKKVLEKIFGSVVGGGSPIELVKGVDDRTNLELSAKAAEFLEPSVTNIESRKPINQVHQVIGTTAYGIHNSKKTGLLLLNNLLGGMGMSSRLNLVVREQHGIAYTIESSYIPFSDTGLFYIYFGTDIDKYEKARKLILKQLALLRNNKLGSGQLHQAKRKFKGQIALGEESRMSLLIAQAKFFLDTHRIQRLDEVFATIDAVTAEELLATANEVFDANRLATLSLLPE